MLQDIKSFNNISLAIILVFLTQLLMQLQDQHYMKCDQMTESLMKSHHANKPSTNLSHYYDWSLEKLYRKFNKSLPQLQRMEQKIKNGPFLCPVTFSPQSKFIICWQILNIILIYIYFIQIPIILAFENQRSLNNNQRIFQYLNTPTIIIFICGIFISINTSFYQDGLLKDDPVEIRQHYLTTTFFLDIISILAIMVYEILQLLEQFQNQTLKLFVVLFYLRLFELLRIQRTMNRSFDLNRRTKSFLKLVLLLLKILLICNIVACSGFYISNTLAKNPVKDADNKDCTDKCYWVMNVQYNGRSLYNYTDAFQIQYIYSLYWASTTMISIGYGDITPKNPTEVTFTVCIQFLSCLLYGYSINEIWSIIQELNAKKSKIHSRLNIINLYMRDKGIDNQLTSKVNAYLNNYYYSKNLRERQMQSQIISELTPSLRKQLFYQSYSAIFNNKYFKKCNQSLKQSACAFVQQVGYYQNQMIFIDINKQPCLYYVKRGELQYSTGNSHTMISNIQSQDVFGIYEFFTRLYFKSELKTKMYTILFYIKASDWSSILKNYNQDCERYYLIKQQILLYKNGSIIKYKCQFCGSHVHRTQDCLDSELRDTIAQRSNLAKYQYNPRKIYPRREFKVHIHERHHKSRKKHNFSQKFQSQHQTIYHKNPNHDKNKARKYSIEDHHIKEKHSKIHIRNHKNQHQNLRALEILRKEHHIKQLQELSNQSVSSYDAQFQELNIDQVADYEDYYPAYNSKQPLRDTSRRRMTRRF